MITIGNTLNSKTIALDLSDRKLDGAVLEIAKLLKNDERVGDWEAFSQALVEKPPSVLDELGFGLCLPHARTNAVRTMVVAAGRSEHGIASPSGKTRIRYIVVIGVPTAMASEYLRIVGALMRIFRDPAVEEQLRTCETSEEFLATLSQTEMKL